MMFNSPKNDHKYYWTTHSKYKLIQYGLSANKIKRIIRFPDRKEEGIAPNTIAVMKRRSRDNPQRGEIWVMYQKNLKSQNSKFEFEDVNSNTGTENDFLINQNHKLRNNFGKIKIISTWIYPGETPKGKEIFIPGDVWKELEGKNYEKE